MITIKRATIEDLETIQELNYELLIHENTIEKDIWDPKWTYSEAGRNYFISKLKLSNNDLCFLAYVDQKPVGYILGFIEIHNWRTRKEIGFIRHLIVKEEYRHKGIGGKLMDRIIEEFKNRKVQVLKLEALVHNQEALEFYKRYGFEGITTFLEVNI